MTSTILYHGTSPEAAEKIIREGLIPARRFVYLTTTVEFARGFGAGAVLKVMVPEGMRLEYYEDCRDWELLCQQTIPSQYIERVE